MLDTETKNRINAARDILVGKVPDPKSQVEQITVAMIYKFMDDMDQEAVEYGGVASFFTGEYEKYAWSKLFDPRLGGFDVLTLYSEAILRMNQNPHIPQLFRDIFKNAYLPYRDPETLKLFLKTVNGFTYDHSERLGDAFEYLLSVLGSQGDAGQFRTPRHIIDFVVKVVDPQKGDTVLDPAGGTAGFLISAYKHILEQNTNKQRGDLLTPDDRKRLMTNFKGYDISPDMVRLSLVNMYLHGFTNPQIFEYDSLTSEERWGEYFDVVLANPPFMSPKGGIKPHSRFSIQSNRSEVLFVDYIAEHLTPNGRAGIIVPEGIIFQSGTAYKSLRKMLVEKYLWAVVSLPAGVFNPYSGVKTSILLLDKNLARKTDKIQFVKIQNDGFDLGAQRRSIEKNDLFSAQHLLAEYKKNILSASSSNYDSDQCVVVEKSSIAATKDYNLSGERYRDNTSEEVTKYDVVELGSIAELEYGFTETGLDSGDVRFIRITDIDVNHRLKRQDAKYINLSEDCKKYFLSKNDILVARTGATFGKTLLFEEDFPAVFASYLIRVKFKANTLLPRFYWYFAQTEFYWQQAQMLVTGGGQPQFNGNAVKQVKVPLPPLPVQQQIVDEVESYQRIIDGARQVVENYKPQIKIDPAWKVATIGETFQSKSGSTPSRSVPDYFTNGSIPWVKTLDLNNADICATEEKITPKAIAETSCQVLPVGSVLIAMYGGYNQIGRTGVLRIGAATNQAITALLPNDSVSPDFLNLVLISYRDKWKEVANSTRKDPNITKQDILNFMIPIPDLETQHRIVTQIEREKTLVNANHELIQIFEQKIKDKIAEVWGEPEQQEAVTVTTPIEEPKVELPMASAPAVTTAKPYRKRAVLAGTIIEFGLERGDPYLGHTKFQKLLYVCENFAEVEGIDTGYKRHDYGPYDSNFFHSFHTVMEKEMWFREVKKGQLRSYEPLINSQTLTRQFDQLYAEQQEKIRFVLEAFAPLNSDEAEVLATLYAVWNNLLIQSEQVTEERLLEEFYGWSLSKKRFPREKVTQVYETMQDLGLVPRGYGQVIV